jgi:hypothetical protein
MDWELIQPYAIVCRRIPFRLYLFADRCLLLYGRMKGAADGRNLGRRLESLNPAPPLLRIFSGRVCCDLHLCHPLCARRRVTGQKVLAATGTMSLQRPLGA